MSIAVVIVNYRTADLTRRCLESVLAERETLSGMRLVVVDGGSDDGSADALAACLDDDRFRGWTHLIALPINGGYGYANNAGIKSLLDNPAPPEFIMLLNPDTVIESGAVASLAQHLRENSHVGAVGSQLLDEDGTETGCAFSFPSLRGELARGARTGPIDRLLRVGPPAFPPGARNFEADWVTGASVMLRAEALRQAGIFDDGFFLYHEEVELMWRMRRAGWSIRTEPLSRVRHMGGAATGVRWRAPPGSKLPRRPAYWYQSRRRFFSLTRGRVVAAAATGMWAIGHLILILRRLAKSSQRQQVMHELRDELRYGLPWRRDVQSPSIDSKAPRAELPAWMKARD